MSESVFISKSQALPPSMDFRFLFEEAIRYAQQFSGDIWTDYNAHDPGVMLLEYLCYAITDLGYRTNFSIEDLLYGKTNPPVEDINNVFYSPSDILPMAPLTINDYRKILIDYAEVNNAWIVPLQNSAYRGLYEVKLQLLAEDDNDPNHFRLLRKIKNQLMKWRNLGEDFARISVLKHQYFSVDGEITLEPDALAEVVMAQLLLALNQYLIPRTQFASRAELNAKGELMERLFDGPLTVHGFLSDQALQNLPAVVYVSEIKDLFLTVEGVRSSGSLNAMIEGVSAQLDELELPEDTYFILDPKMLSGENLRKLKMRRNGFDVPVNYQQVNQIYQRLLARENQQYHSSMEKPLPKLKSKKRLNDIKAYHSFQRFLPAVYGLGTYGLPSDADNLRKAQARQLKAFLALPEVLLSSYLAQLTELKNFFSVAEDQLETPSYFYQFPFDIPDVQALLHPSLGENDPAEINQKLQEKLAHLDAAGERRNHFLDHLLARFGERFDQSVFQRIALVRGWEPEEANGYLLRAKAHYLREITSLSKRRSCGYNYLQSSWGKKGKEANVSGLKARLYHHLYLMEAGNESLTQLPDFAGFKAAPKSAENTEGVRLSLRQLLAHGQSEENYHFHRTATNQYELYFQPSLHEKPQLVASVGNAAAAEQQRDMLVTALRELEDNSLGFFIVEHLLLRPQRFLGRKMKVDIQEGPVVFYFKSFHYQEQEKVTNSSNNFLLTAANSANLEKVDVVINGEEFGLLIIMEDGYPILKSQLFPGGKDAIPVSALLDLLNKKKKLGSASINNWISFETEPDYGQAIEGDFFSQRISLVLPSWPKAFQSPAFRQLFETLLAENIPAHLSAKTHWFGMSKMRDFEEKYKNWLNVKAQGEDLVHLDNCSLDLIALLCKEDIYAEVNIAAKEEEKEHLALKQTLFEQLGYSFLFRGAELQIIEGVGPVLNQLLVSYGIDTWKELAGTPKKQLETILKTSGLKLHVSRVDQWLTQARLAARGQWTELIELQRKLNARPNAKGGTPAKLERYTRQHFKVRINV